MVVDVVIYDMVSYVGKTSLKKKKKKKETLYVGLGTAVYLINSDIITLTTYNFLKCKSLTCEVELKDHTWIIYSFKKEKHSLNL